MLAPQGCQPADAALAAESEKVSDEPNADFDYELAADHSAYRWIAIGRGYERLGLLNHTLDAGDVSAFRWLAMARGYERLGMLTR